MSRDLGRLIRTTSDKCPLCKKPLQVRARIKTSRFKDKQIEKEIQYLSCSGQGCEYESSLKQKERKVHPNKYEEDENGLTKSSRDRNAGRAKGQRSNRGRF
jgi:hypothetical protein